MVMVGAPVQTGTRPFWPARLLTPQEAQRERQSHDSGKTIDDVRSIWRGRGEGQNRNLFGDETRDGKEGEGESLGCRNRYTMTCGWVDPNRALKDR